MTSRNVDYFLSQCGVIPTFKDLFGHEAKLPDLIGLLKKYPVTECSPRLNAHCHTFVGNNGAAVLSCWGSALDCTEAAKGAKGASACAQWD